MVVGSGGTAMLKLAFAPHPPVTQTSVRNPVTPCFESGLQKFDPGTAVTYSTSGLTRHGHSICKAAVSQRSATQRYPSMVALQGSSKSSSNRSSRESRRLTTANGLVPADPDPCQKKTKRSLPALPFKFTVADFRTGPEERLRSTGIAHGSANGDAETEKNDEDGLVRNLVWAGYALYMLWLILLPYAPGDPVWAITPETIKMLQELSLNFFYILPALNAVGQEYMQAPVLHPSAEGLFNVVNAWSLMFGPLLVADCRRGRWGGSVELLWAAQMFLTNIFLLPYMALRQNPPRAPSPPSSSPFAIVGEKLGESLVSNAKSIGVIGIVVGIVSVFWILIGRPNGGFGELSDRWAYFLEYVGTDRAAYAFLFDLILYSIFQAWLIGDNLKAKDGLSEGSELRDLVGKLRFVPFFGLAAYLILWPLEIKAKDE